MFCLLKFLLALLFLGFLEDEILEGEELLRLIDLRVLDKIFINLINGCLNAALTAVARFDLHDLSKPIDCGIVDGFSDVETKVKPAVVRPSKNSNDTMLLMLSFRNSKLRIFLFKVIRID